MQKRIDALFHLCIRVTAFMSVGLLLFLIAFLAVKSVPAFCEVGVTNLLLGDEWRPLIYSEKPLFGLRNMLLATIIVSALAGLFAGFIGIGCALFLSCGVTDKIRAVLMPFIDLLAGIPSVIYGFIGLFVVVKALEHLGRSTGESVLAGALVLAVMILPFVISSTTHSMVNLYHRHAATTTALGVSRWYTAAELILPASKRGILISMGLALGRAMGETMAVMMVMGNAPIFPTLLGKGETIPALIALEMGTAELGSLHFSSLFAAGFFLFVVLLIINVVFTIARKRLIEERL